VTQLGGAALQAEATALLQRGEHAACWALCRSAVEDGSADAMLVNLAGMARFHAGEKQAGLLLIEKAATMAPDNPDILGNLGNARLGRNDVDGAIDAYRRAIDRRGNEPSVWRNLAAALIRTDRQSELRTCLERLATLAPKDPWPLVRLAIVAEAQDRTAEAIVLYRSAIARDPKSTDARNRLGVLLGRLDKVGEAIDCYRHVLEIDPENGAALARIVLELERACIWAEAAPLRARLIAKSDAAIATGRRSDELPFAQLGYEEDPARILALARNVSATIAARAGAKLPPALAPADPARVLRIGYLSHDFRTHAVAQLSWRLFELHDRASFHISAYSTGPDDSSALRRDIARQADRFHDIRALTHRQAAERIRADQIDILVDMTGHTAGSRLDIAALRPAPLQVSWLGYPATTGAAFIDYMLADPTVVPPGEEQYYSEAICRLPHSYLMTDNRQPIANAVPTRASENLPERGFVFCSFNNMHKIEPEIFALWMDLMRDVPDAVLWLHAYNEPAARQLRAAAKAHTIDPARLIFAGRPDKPAHLARARLADLALDTRLYNGHTTTIDMLWAGVPVVTWPGRAFQGRVSASLLKSIKLSELIARDGEGYRTIALMLARDPAALSALKARLAANRTHCPLFDTKRFVRHIERAYREIWKRACAGGKPGTLDISAI
jgi:predicted O-linked N-acetylglucosamine transferase (SPINDLY family)